VLEQFVILVIIVKSLESARRPDYSQFVGGTNIIDLYIYIYISLCLISYR